MPRPAARAARRLAPILLLLALSPPTPGLAGQQDRDVSIEIRSSLARPLRLALPAFRALSGTAEDARLIHEVLWDDLHWSMAFELLDPADYPDTAPGESIPWEEWQRLGAEALVQGIVQREGELVVVELRTFDVGTRQQVIGKRYRDVPDRARLIAHRFSDETVLYYTGIRGVAMSQIAFISNREAPAGSAIKEIYIMDYDGVGQRRITYDNSIALSPSFSPQGDRIVYQTYRAHDGIPNAEIYLIRKAGGSPQPVVTCQGTNNGPVFSPDGTLVLLSSSCDGNSELYTVRPDGTDLTRITRNPASDVSPTWSSNGRQVAFTSDRAGSQQIYVMDATGLNTRRLRGPGGQKDDPAWNPVQRRFIAYTASTGGNNFDIFVYDLTTDRTHQLTSGSGRKEAPMWSPDGRQIVFEWARDGSVQIWAMGLDGSRQRKLTNVGDNLTPAWGNRP